MGKEQRVVNLPGTIKIKAEKDLFNRGGNLPKKGKLLLKREFLEEEESL